MHGVAPHMCGQVGHPLLDRGAGGRSPGHLARRKAGAGFRKTHSSCGSWDRQEPQVTNRWLSQKSLNRFGVKALYTAVLVNRTRTASPYARPRCGAGREIFGSGFRVEIPQWHHWRIPNVATQLRWTHNTIRGFHGAAFQTSTWRRRSTSHGRAPNGLIAWCIRRATARSRRARISAGWWNDWQLTISMLSTPGAVLAIHIFSRIAWTSRKVH